jgi:polypeptide N-acetylgalactosaminyltransferase
MENVAFDLMKYYPPVPIPPYAKGEIKNMASDVCIDAKFKNENQVFVVDKCQSSNNQIGGEQKFELTWRSEIKTLNRDKCFDVSSSNIGDSVNIYTCHGLKGNQEFQYYLVTKDYLFNCFFYFTLY